MSAYLMENGLNTGIMIDEDGEFVGIDLELNVAFTEQFWPVTIRDIKRKESLPKLRSFLTGS